MLIEASPGHIRNCLIREPIKGFGHTTFRQQTCARADLAGLDFPIVKDYAPPRLRKTVSFGPQARIQKRERIHFKTK